MGQQPSVPKSDYDNLMKEYGNITCDYDVVEDELLSMYDENDRLSRDAHAKQNRMRKFQKLLRNAMPDLDLDDGDTPEELEKKYKARLEMSGNRMDPNVSADIENTRRIFEQEKKAFEQERELFRQERDRYQQNAHLDTNDVDQLKAKLIFNEAQYNARRALEDHNINKLLQENNALRKGRVPQSAEDALAENERLQAALNRAITAEKELRDGYAAVQRFLDEGNFGGNQDLREELRKKEERIRQLEQEKQDYESMLDENFNLQEVNDQLNKENQELKMKLGSSGDDRVKELEESLKKLRQVSKKSLQQAMEKNEELMKQLAEKNEEIEDLKRQLVEGDLSDLELGDTLTPEQEFVARRALRKQAKAYREKEKNLLKRIRDLEDRCCDNVNIRTAIDEAVHEVVKRANDMQTRLKAENEALKLRIRQLDDTEADGDFLEIEDVVKNAIEGSDEDVRKLREEYYRLSEANHLLEGLNKSFEEQLLDSKDKYNQLYVDYQALLDEMGERDEEVESLEKNHDIAVRNAMRNLTEKYARESGADQNLINRMLEDLDAEDAQEYEIGQEVVDARIKASVSMYRSLKKPVETPVPPPPPPPILTPPPKKAPERRDMSTDQVEDYRPPHIPEHVPRGSENLWQAQRLIKKLLFENKRMMAIIEDNNLQRGIGLNSFEMAELDALYDDYWGSGAAEAHKEVRKLNDRVRELEKQLDIISKIQRNQEDTTVNQVESVERIRDLERRNLALEHELEERQRETRVLEGRLRSGDWTASGSVPSGPGSGGSSRRASVDDKSWKKEIDKARYDLERDRRDFEKDKKELDKRYKDYEADRKKLDTALAATTVAHVAAAAAPASSNADKSRADKAERELTAIKKEKDLLADKLKKTENDLNRNQQDVIEMENEISELKRDVEEKDDTIRLLEDQKQALEQTVKQLNNQLTDKSKKPSAQEQSELENSLKKIAELELLISTLQMNSKTVEDERNAIDNELKEREEMIVELRDALEMKATELDELREANNKLNEQMANVEEDRDGIEKERDDRMAEVDDLKQTNLELNDRVLQMTDAMDVLSMENEKYKQMMTQTSNNLDAANKDFEEVKAKLQNQSYDDSSMDRERMSELMNARDLRDEADAAKQLAEEKTAEVDRLQDELEEMRQQMQQQQQRRR